MALNRILRLAVDTLIADGKLSDGAKAKLLAPDADYTQQGLETYLIDECKVSPFAVLSSRATSLGRRPVNLARVKVSPKTWEFIDQEYCTKANILPIGYSKRSITLAYHGPLPPDIMSEVLARSGKEHVHILIAFAKDIKERAKPTAAVAAKVDFAEVMDRLSDQFSPPPEIELPKEGDLVEDSAPIIDLANRIIEDAYYDGASDIHIDPYEKDVAIRYRVDGSLKEKLRIPSRMGPALLARLKIMCNLDIAERRLPQDGRIIFKKYTKKGLDVDLRVSTAPLNHGEGIVMRILDKQKSTLPMTALGFSEDNLTRYREAVRSPYGMILHCGPTGSGKSMTLYSALNEINTPDLSIRTAEDPIEYTLEGINQMQMQRQIGLTFATALRAFLRQDPDIILVGEIRDKETAGIAIEAALTGHLLISTLHTNDAPTTIARLTDMGIETFMISSSLVCVCAQRLMRRVCKSCKEPITPEGRQAEILAKALDGWTGPIFRARNGGCEKCGGSGYKGRVGIHELMTSNQELIDAINKGAEAAELKRIARKGGMKTLHEDSMLKVKMGLTTMEESLSTVPVDM